MVFNLYKWSYYTVQGAHVDWKVVGDDVMLATDTNEQGTPPPRGHDLARIVAALTHQSKGSLLQRDERHSVDDTGSGRRERGHRTHSREGGG